jgi:hypothetical protein
LASSAIRLCGDFCSGDRTRWQSCVNSRLPDENR